MNFLLLLFFVTGKTVTNAFSVPPAYGLHKRFIVSKFSQFATTLVESTDPSFLENTREDVSMPVMSSPSSTVADDFLTSPKPEPSANAIINTLVLLGIAGAILFNLVSADVGIERGWTPEEVAARIPADMWTSYISTLASRPIETKAITSATVYTIGDVIAQKTEGTSIGELDRMRTLRSSLAGLIGHGPLSHVWYNVCDNFFENILQLHAWWSFIPKVVVDQTVWGPIWNNTYILLLGLMKMDSFPEMWSNMKRSTVPLILSGLKLWPLAHCVTYGLIPVENRLLWVDFVEIFWVTILATQASSQPESATPALETTGSADSESK